eukprot:gene10725-14403_t
MEEATHLAALIVVSEVLFRQYQCPVKYIKTRTTFTEFTPGYWFLLAYFLCIMAILLNLKEIQFFKSALIRNTITVLHAIDGIIALVIGLGIYFESNLIVIVGIICITKFFLLYLLSRMVTGQTSFSKTSMIIQTTKTFLHHTGSFLFISNPKVALITAMWRFISMNGHAVMTLRGKLSDNIYSSITWKITHSRNAILVIVLITCWFYPAIRRGFAVSAVGHLAYMLVRLGPVFRLGTLYLVSKADKEEWQTASDLKRIKLLFIDWKHPYFALEIGILLIACVYFAYLRLTTSIILLSKDTCSFT